MKKAEVDLKDSPFGALGMAIGQNMVDTMVDTNVSPSNFSSLAAGTKPQPGNEDSHASNRGQGSEPFKNARYKYDSLSRFSVWVNHGGGGDVRFILSRDGLSWKLTNIVVPKGLESLPGLADTGSTLPEGNNLPSETPLKIETVDTRVTEANDVWSRFAWKLTLHDERGADPYLFVDFLHGFCFFCAASLMD